MTNKNLTSSSWWRSAVIYQVYPRSFADSNGDGIGDLPGITSKLDYLKDLGIDALWLSPFYTSPQNDAGYDVADYCDVDPLFGTLQDFDQLLAEAHARDMRIIVDIVPNHSSSDHKWFQAALASPPGSPERERYMFRDGKGPDGNEPPNNWQAIFGGNAWTRVTEADGSPGQWYLHLFDPSQPDLNWENPWVRDRFDEILRFWLDRGVDGFRVDVAHGMIKAEGLPDYNPNPAGDSMGGDEHEVPYWGQPGVHEIYRRWNKIVRSYPGDRALCGEAWVNPLSKLALWVRPDEMQQTFNFAFLTTDWRAADYRSVIDESIAAFSSVGAPSTWVLSNHDVIRHHTRFGLREHSAQGHGIGPESDVTIDVDLGARRGRAATTLMFALPGSSYLFQGEELGLPEVIDIPDDRRRDPTWARTNGQRYGRDGCRVPLPWAHDEVSYGFSAATDPWLPQPEGWGEFAADLQLKNEGSTLQLYRLLLRLRRQYLLGRHDLRWVEDLPGQNSDVLAFDVGEVRVISVFDGAEVPLPEGWDVLVSSSPLDGDTINANTTVWLRRFSDATDQ